jgi:hypothetical protein
MRTKGNMTTLMGNSRRHLGQAYVCREEAGTADALRLSTEITCLLESIDELTTYAFEAYVDFKQFQAVTESAWSSHPNLYSEQVQIQIDKTCAVWCDIAKQLTRLMDFAEGQGQTLEHGDKFRHQYAAMLSVEMMDHGPMPAHMISLSKQAHSEVVAGVGIESIGPDGF